MTADTDDELRLHDPDGFYARLVSLYDGLDADAVNRLNATIILLMANAIGDDARLAAILERAKSVCREG
ncbi:MAG: DUF2783 domain-containing protein [Gammaproteobacteria bacterium]|nr:DUF2783 domain-containing protein [Gammaproteobacteria bacterium]